MRSSSCVLVIAFVAGCTPKTGSAPIRRPSAPASTAAQARVPESRSGTTESEWVASKFERRLPGTREEGKTYFRSSRETRTKTFHAMFESALDPRDSVTGTFPIAQFRYVYPSALDSDGQVVPSHDESVSTVLLDCPEHLSATLSVTYKLKGHFVRRDDTPEDRVLMTPNPPQSTVADLCDFLNDREPAFGGGHVP